jgi:uncharacterized protein YndB with AHSA1/START domain
VPKWVVGCLAVGVALVGLVVWLVYSKYKTFTGAGPSVSVVIDAPATRVFASMADADSLREWRAETTGISSTRRGLLRVGDTVRILSRTIRVGSRTSGSDSTERLADHVVTALVPDRLLVFEARDDSSGATMIVRRDSLVARGDSTEVISTILVPVADSIRARVDTANRGERAMFDMASRLMISIVRMQFGVELERLKERIEGREAPPQP